MSDLIERTHGPTLSAVATSTPPSAIRGLRLVVADPRRLIAEALALAVLGEPTFEIVATLWGDLQPQAIAQVSPDMVLLGVGADEERALVLVADAPTRRLLGAVMERSLGGLLLTDHPASDLVASLAHIARGQAVLPSGWQAALARSSSEPVDSLSDRQLEVLRLLAEGCSYEEIGSRLFISINTVKFHTRSIFERLGVHNRMAAVRLLAGAR